MFVGEKVLKYKVFDFIVWKFELLKVNVGKNCEIK